MIFPVIGWDNKISDLQGQALIKRVKHITSFNMRFLVSVFDNLSKFSFNLLINSHFLFLKNLTNTLRFKDNFFIFELYTFLLPFNFLKN